jgi:hypothetical protein
MKECLAVMSAVLSALMSAFMSALNLFYRGQPVCGKPGVILSAFL